MLLSSAWIPYSCDWIPAFCILLTINWFNIALLMSYILANASASAIWPFSTSSTKFVNWACKLWFWAILIWPCSTNVLSWVLILFNSPWSIACISVIWPLIWPNILLILSKPVWTSMLPFWTSIRIFANSVCTFDNIANSSELYLLFSINWFNISEEILYNSMNAFASSICPFSTSNNKLSNLAAINSFWVLFNLPWSTNFSKFPLTS